MMMGMFTGPRLLLVGLLMACLQYDVQAISYRFDTVQKCYNYCAGGDAAGVTTCAVACDIFFAVRKLNPHRNEVAW